MEQEFDKEIDALLRKLPRANVSPGDGPASVHLEPDQFASFAENATPAAARQVLTLHLAECERCRGILSETVRMNSEAAPLSETATSAPAINATGLEVPWYRRLFLFPNLAYVMGGLVLVFSGFLGYVALRDNGVGGATVSQVVNNEAPATSAPDADASEYGGIEQLSANSAANTAVPATNSVAMPSNRGVANASSATIANGYADAKREDTAAGAPFTVDGLAAGQPAPPPPPPAAATDSTTAVNERAKAAELSKAKDDSGGFGRLAESKVAQEREEAKLRSVQGAAAKKSAPAGPSRDMQAQFPNRAQNYDQLPPTKNAGGKSFEFRDGVWYDTAYRRQPFTTVRRGTEAFLRLDAGLRSIAEAVGGTSVIVWNSKAYRIQ
jgi:hypothetical protein